MQKFKSKKNIFFSFIGTTLLAIIFWFLYTFSANLWIEPSSGTLIKWCPYNFQIILDTTTEKTSSLDTKLFLDNFLFNQITSSDLDNISLLTGNANSGSRIGDEYFYINAYQDINNSSISGSNINIADIQFVVSTWIQNSGNLEFYFLWSRINSDDSNISKWENSDSNKYTKYIDILDNVTNWSYDFITANSCEDAPIIISGLYHQAVFTDTSTWAQILNLIAWPKFDYPINYSWDTSWNIPNHSTWREIWTNTSVVLKITWDKTFMIDETSLSWLSAFAINNILETTWKTIIITWNISQSSIRFISNGAFGTEYNYNIWWSTITGDFFIDVFWIDTYLAPLTGSVEYKNLYASVYLTWYTWWVSWTYKDDEYKIISFSGVESAPTNFLLNTDNIFSLYHEILFTGGRSGDIIYVDRAGNTWSFFVYVNDILSYDFFAKPNSRLVTSFTPNPNLASKYILNFYKPDKSFVCSGELETDNFWSWVFRSFEPLSWSYYISVKWLAHLEQIMSWVVIKTGTKNLINTFSWRENRPLWLKKDDEIIYDFEYMQIAWPIFINNLSIYSQYTGTFIIWDAYSLIDSVPFATSYSSGVYRNSISSNIWNTWKLNYSLKVTDPEIDNFETKQNRLFYSGTINISQSWYFNGTSTNGIHTFQIPWELVYDGEINGVDSSVIIQYIREHGATYSNNTFWFVPEDLNANGRVDAADITIHWYNLYRIGETINKM